MVTSAPSDREPPATAEGNCWVSICTTGRLHHGFMGNDGRMHVQPGVDARPDTGVPAQRRTGGYPPTTSFRTRRSALSAAQQQTWERLWPELGTVARDSDGPIEPLDTRAWFGRDAPVVLEIGCGTGASTVAMAQSEPGVDVIAVEVYRRGLAQLLGAIDRENVGNIRLIRGDAVDVLEHLVAPGSLTGVRVFFPDPWPKARHHKRRLLQPATVALIADRLKPGGVLHAATDHAGYAEQIAEVGDTEPRLRRVDPNARPLPIAVVRPTTKYETKARYAGSAVTELVWERR
jgi:tRNA (guanine-N7-)-methyltransferase